MWQLNEESPVQLPYTRDKEIKKMRFFINPFLALLVFILGNRIEFFPPTPVMHLWASSSPWQSWFFRVRLTVQRTAGGLLKNHRRQSSGARDTCLTCSQKCWHVVSSQSVRNLPKHLPCDGSCVRCWETRMSRTQSLSRGLQSRWSDSQELTLL